MDACGAMTETIRPHKKYRNVTEDLPLSANAGVGYRILDTYSNLLVAGTGISYRKGENNLSLKYGLDYLFSEVLAVRLNYASTLSIGLGLLFSRSQLDYSWANIAGVENLHYVTYALKFGLNGSLGRGIAYNKKGMHARALKCLSRIPEGHKDYARAREVGANIKTALARLPAPAPSAVAQSPAVSPPSTQSLPPSQPPSPVSPVISDISKSVSGEKYPVSVRIMKDIPTSIYYLLGKINVAPINVRIGNNTPKTVNFKITYRYEPKTHEETVRINVPAGKETQINLTPILPSQMVSTIRIKEFQIARIAIYNITDDGELKKIGDDFMEYVTFHPCDQYFPSLIDLQGNKINTMETLVSWITYNDFALSPVMSKASSRGSKLKPPVKIVGRQDPGIFGKSIEQKDEDFLKQIKVIYDTLKEDYEIMYLNQPIVDRTGRISTQKVKYPSETLQYKGNCIELAVLFAALLESIEINPIITLLPNDGHCVVGWEVSGESKSVYHLLETNLFGEDFEKVFTKGKLWIEKYDLGAQFASGINFDRNGIYRMRNDVIIYNVGKMRGRIPRPRILRNSYSAIRFEGIAFCVTIKSVRQALYPWEKEAGYPAFGGVGGFK
ncbi:MAG: hypothetical protein AB1633_03270 [Elusimicrobiota bacterium]